MSKIRRAFGQAVSRALNKTPGTPEARAEVESHARSDKAMRERDNAIQIMGALQQHIDRRIQVLKHEAATMRSKRGA